MDSSQLSRLPPEIRDQIYHTLFTSKYAVTLQSGHVQHPLTITCRQIRQETLAMYYALTRFNAHLDDGPATPLAKWLTTLGPKLTLILGEVNIWVSLWARDHKNIGMHMLNGTLYGEDRTQELLNRAAPDEDEYYILRPIGNWVFNRGWYLKDIILSLHSMGLGLSRICIKNSSPTVKLTSDFAIVRLTKANQGEIFKDEYTEVNSLAKQFGLTERARENLILQLAAGERTVTLQERHRKLILEFDEGDGTRLTSMRQVFTSESLADVDWAAMSGGIEDSHD
ncbi:hypothetical protein HII31_08852 [Pseudocercospora fuligena]|uniref:Uncharacterized protein n=1 Tax=Pseudocercospora fuligena TaxID=685502 RepID=A0A8H6VFQ5_9PEZI|nr:hypothetical protein HII31_08852 [Pseudocercospora fuligena]